MAKQISTTAVTSSNYNKKLSETIGFLNISVRGANGSLSKLGAIYIQNTPAGTAIAEYLYDGGDLEKVIDKLEFTYNPANRNVEEFFEF